MGFYMQCSEVRVKTNKRKCSSGRERTWAWRSKENLREKSTKKHTQAGIPKWRSHTKYHRSRNFNNYLLNTIAVRYTVHGYYLLTLQANACTRVSRSSKTNIENALFRNVEKLNNLLAKVLRYISYDCDIAAHGHHSNRWGTQRSTAMHFGRHVRWALVM